jgi:membrane protein
MNRKSIYYLLKDTFQQWSEDKASRLAAALAYYTVFSLPPLLILVIAVAGTFLGEEAARGEVVSQLRQFIGSDGAELIETIITGASQSGKGASFSASMISIGVLIFGATAVVIQLQDALNTIWEVTPKPGHDLRNFIFNRILSFGMVLGVAFLLLVSLVLSAMLALLSNMFVDVLPSAEAIASLLDLSLSFLVATLLFALMFKFLPDAKIAWGDVFIGALITALLFSIGKWAIGLYLGKSTFGSTYGAAGSLVVLLAWIYYSAQILFFGAEFTQVYARRFGSKIEPADYAVSVTERERAQQGIPRH